MSERMVRIFTSAGGGGGVIGRVLSSIALFYHKIWAASFNDAAHIFLCDAMLFYAG
jgi:hypothetical protein